MHRILAIAVLATLLTGPASRLACGWACGNVTEAATVEKCHEEGGAGPVFGIAVDHCDGSGLPFAVTTKLRDDLAVPLLGLRPYSVSTGVPLSLTVSVSPGPTTGSPPNRLIPLRI